jgi:Lrp/AsnC family transcriptional regulator, leucine-responsive regulatory protein
MPSSWHAIQRHVLAKDAEIGDKNAITCLFWSEDFDDMPKPDLDPADCRIVAELQANGRLSNVELADKIGLSPSPCLRRVKRLEREGYIEGYRAALRRERIGLGFSVFIGVKIDGHTNERALQFEKAVVAMPEVVACHLVSGEADYFLEVVVPDLGDYQRFLVGKLLNLPIVREVRSNIAIQTLKAGAPLPLEHFEMEQAQTPAQAAKHRRPERGGLRR